MFKNYFTIAGRNFLKYKNYAVINLLGLAAGIACCLLILLHVQEELRFDTFHHNAGRIFRIVEARQTSSGEHYSAFTVPPLGPALQRDFSEVEASVRFLLGWRLTVKNGETRHIMRNYFFSEPGFFEVFDFALLAGEAHTALAAPRTVILTETAAHKFFGTENPMGKTLQIEAEDFPDFARGDFVVTGVLRDPPHNSHLDFEMLLSLSTLQAFPDLQKDLQSWSPGYGAATYVLLHDAKQRELLAAQLPAFSRKYRGEELAAKRTFSLQPLTDIHFHSSHIDFEANAHEGELVYVYIFAALAVFIALLACINYMNLATARALQRAKEVGMRKAMGAGKTQLVVQFLSEACGTTLLAMLIALVLVELALPWFNALAGKQLALPLASNAAGIAGLVAIALVLGLIAGSYPAFYLSRFPPMAVLKGTLRSDSGHTRLRRVLVMSQFAVSISMLVATFVVYQQLQYVRHKKLGFNPEQLLVIDINSDEVQSNFTTVKHELLRNPAVHSVTVSSRVPGDWKGFRQIQVARTEAPENETRAMYFNGVDEDFLKTYEINLVSGRNFSRELASDSAALLLNETAARLLFGEAALGQYVRVPAANFQGQVIGVVQDFHFHSLHDQIAPMVMGFMPTSGHHALHGIDYFTLRVSSESIPATVAFITGVHEQFDHSNPIELDFLGKWWHNLYQSDERVGKIFGGRRFWPFLSPASAC